MRASFVSFDFESSLLTSFSSEGTQYKTQTFHGPLNEYFPTFACIWRKAGQLFPCHVPLVLSTLLSLMLSTPIVTAVETPMCCDGYRNDCSF